MRETRVGYYGDDVTGSIDVLLQFARLGVDGRLFIGVPDTEALADAREHAVVGIAGVARSLPTADIDAEVRPALETLRDLDRDIVQYKACSTADSSPRIGSLGRVIEIARDVFGERPAPALFAQPDFGRYTAFGHHFAAEGGTLHRLDRQPTMSAHPSTPMDESDLARHLGRQTSLPIGGLPFTAYASASDVADALAATDDAAVVLDALDDIHLALIGEALRRLASDAPPLFVLGSGGLSRAIALAGEARRTTIAAPGAAGGPVLAVSGSRSASTRRQADAAAAAGWLVRPFGEGAADEALAALRAGRSAVLTSDDAPMPADALAEIARAAASVVGDALRTGATTRIVVCGGDTSGRVVRLLGVQSLSIAANPAGNVVVLRAHSADPHVDGAELLLKGGQVGADDLFVRLGDSGA